MTEPVGVDAAMERLDAATTVWLAAAPTSVAAIASPESITLVALDVRLLLDEVHRLRDRRQVAVT